MTAIDIAIKALEKIDEVGCIDLGPREMRCCEPGAADEDGVPLTIDSWCHPCVAHDAINQIWTEFPEETER